MVPGATRITIGLSSITSVHGPIWALGLLAGTTSVIVVSFTELATICHVDHGAVLSATLFICRGLWRRLVGLLGSGHLRS